tara:strand:+ start:2001 stop:2405 length:405 start_codon:yes stop_codon:yes gene_type:complete
MRRYPSDPVVWTNALFLVNGGLWYESGEILAATSVAIAGISSMVYHWHRETVRWAHRLDYVAAFTAAVTTLYTSKLTLLGYFLIALLMGVGLSFKIEAHAYGRDRYYDGYHVAWHLSVFAAQLILLISLHTEFV